MSVQSLISRACFCVAVFGLSLSFDPAPVVAQNSSDITSILDKAGPPQNGGGGLRAIVDAEPPSGTKGPALATFYQKRGNAALSLGRIQQSVTDLRRALKIVQSSNGPEGVIARDLGVAEMRAGNLRAGLRAARVLIEAQANLRPGQRLAGMAFLARVLLANGQLEQTEDVIEDMRKIVARFPARVPAFRRTFVNANILDAEARLFALTGKPDEAEKNLSQATSDFRAVADQIARNPQGAKLLDNRLTTMQIAHARVLMTLGREVEAESLMRDAVKRNLQKFGKFTPLSANAVDWLARTIFAQGRFAEAEALGREAESIMQGMGARESSVNLLRIRLGVARSMAGQERWSEAVEIVRDIDKLTGESRLLRSRTISENVDSALVYYKVGDVEAGLRVANELFERASRRLEEKHFRVALSRGFVGIGKYLKGEHEAALIDFRASIPILLSDSRRVDDEDTVATAGALRVRAVLDGYMGALAHVYGNVPTPEKRAEIAAEAFRISDAARGSSVQRAVAQSSARAAARDPQLAKLVRTEQDLLRRISALFGLLTALQSASEGESDAGTISDLRRDIDNLRGERADVREDLEQRFPDYVRLIDPPPAELDEVRRALADDESIYVTYVVDDQTYVWAFGKSGEIGFQVVSQGRADLGQSAAQLRRALDPQAVTLADIPDFDTGLAHDLYRSLMAPVSVAWKDTPHLIVVADGPLGQIPFSLLPTAPSDAATDKAILFDSYQDVPWLTRTHSVTVMPSVASLVALRSLSDTQSAERAFLGFGDPIFSDGQVAQTPLPEANDAVVSRGGLQLRNVPVRLRSLPRTQDVDAAEFSRLPRLPDTADEIQAMATALKADTSRDVFLGKAAAEPAVEQAPLDQYRVIAFATHGLVPGDLSGLVQPALALTAPHIAGDQDGDGLLQMGEIFGLEMNADWVVLSACNTGTAAGAGAEAVSGLGRAFFYAGTRALLVSNWPVETTSARILTTDVFARQATSPGLTRAEALRQAQVALIDGPGFPDPRNGKPLFSYAHPIFWAPFSLIGEGGDFKVASAPIRSSRAAETEDRPRADSSSGSDNFQVFGD